MPKIVLVTFSTCRAKIQDFFIKEHLKFFHNAKIN